MGWDDLYAEVQSGVTGVDTNTYRVRVDAVRTRAQSRLLFVDLDILAGPMAGKMAQVNIYLPKPGDRNAGFHFRNKIAGFGDLSATFAAMAQVDPDGSNVEGALDILAQAILNQTVDADLVLRGDDAGQYAGTNELAKTKAADSIASVGATQPTPPATPQPSPPSPPAPTSPPQPVQPTQDAAPAAVPAAATAPVAEDVPF